jgi:hypothetical protein
MAQATAISIRKFHAAVNSAVAAAHKKHSKIPLPPKVDEVVYFPYLIWGFPVPEPLVSQLGKEGLGGLTAIAGEIATHIQGAVPEAHALTAAGPHRAAPGAVVAFDRYLIMGGWILPQQIQGLKE